MNRVDQSYSILDDRLRLPNGMYLASPSVDYWYVWLRDSFYEVMPYLDKDCHRYTETYHRILDIFREYEWKLDLHTEQKPHYMHEYLHPRYDAVNVREIDVEWGNCQHDAIGAVLFGIAEGIRVGKPIMRDNKDREIVEKLIKYLYCCQYWIDADNGMWEEWREIHSSSVGACVAGLQAIKRVGFPVPSELILRGWATLDNMFPSESADRPVDLAQLSLIYPYKVLVGEDAEFVVKRVEAMLLRERGVARYQGDSYYVKDMERNLPLKDYHGKEAEWTFGLPWLALCHMEFGNIKQAEKYIRKTEKVMLEDGSLPELYYAKSNIYNGNTPLGWSNALYILAKEGFDNYGKAKTNPQRS